MSILQKKDKCAFKFSELITRKGRVQVFLTFSGEKGERRSFISLKLAPQV
jgi:hypothetical protein